MKKVLLLKTVFGLLMLNGIISCAKEEDPSATISAVKSDNERPGSDEEPPCDVLASYEVRNSSGYVVYSHEVKSCSAFGSGVGGNIYDSSPCPGCEYKLSTGTIRPQWVLNAGNEGIFWHPYRTFHTTVSIPPTTVGEYNCSQLGDSRTQYQSTSAVSLATFLNAYAGQKRPQIVTQASISANDGGYTYVLSGASFANGPNFRYVYEPTNPKVVIDMRVMLCVAPWPNFIANSRELMEWASGSPDQYDSQYYYSLALGQRFITNYAAVYLAEPTRYAECIYNFLTTSTGPNGQPNRSPITDPTLISCP